MEHWTVGHSFAFIIGLVLAYMFWLPTKLIKTAGDEAELILRSGLVVFTVISLIAFASMASMVLGISGAFAILAGGLFGLQLATIPAFPVVRGQKTSEKPPEAERATESEKK